MAFCVLLTEINVCSKSHSTIVQIYQNMIKLITFFTIFEGFETDSAKSSLGFLDDLSEGHLLFFIFWFFLAASKKKSKKGSHLTPETVPGVQKRGLTFPWSKKNSFFFLECPRIWWFLYNSSKFWNPKGKLQYFLVSRRCVYLRGNDP